MPTNEARLERALRQVSFLRWLVIVLATLALLGAATPLVVIVFQQQATEAATVQITCSGFENQVSQLEALRALERRLGIPVDFDIPDLPEECR